MTLPHDLQGLAAGCGIETGYYDINGRWIEPRLEAIVATLLALGIDIEREGGIEECRRDLHRTFWRQAIEPVIVTRPGEVTEVSVRMPAARQYDQLTIEVVTEERGFIRYSILPPSEPSHGADVDGTPFVGRRIETPPLPAGYHQLRISGAAEGTALVISAPEVCYSPDERREWGVFAPLYGIHSQSSWGGGNFSDFRRLAGWVRGLGGSLVATLPLLPAFLGEPFEASPYSPVSRLFWNEVFIDVTRIPELESDSGLRARIAASNFRGRIEALRDSSLVDYREWYRLVREIVEPLAASFFRSRPEARWNKFQQFLESSPRAEDYATFRATDEKQQRRWQQWPESWRSGSIPESAFSERAKQFHLYAQWIADEQLAEISDRSDGNAAALYLDYPLGVNGDGYDSWSEREVFAAGVSVGAPPDTLFTGGQNWGFSPFHPWRLRASGYRYFIESIGHQLRKAKTLRIDHVMAFHRLFWIPPGFGASDGVYVRYRDEELFAILCLESHRYQSMIIGEDLGTVPQPVRDAMDRHQVRRMFVLQYEASDVDPPVREVPKSSVASVNTHDMPTFAAYADSLDGEREVKMGLLDEESARSRKERRRQVLRRLAQFLRQRSLLASEDPGSQELTEGVLSFLASSDAEIVLANLEDLWGETSPQNVPGTSTEHANWQRKLARPLEQIIGDGSIEKVLQRVDRLRKDAEQR